MTHLAKLTSKTVDRSTKRDPIIARRDKLVAGLKEQKLVHAVALRKQDHRVERHKWMTNEQGERVAVKAMRTVRPWFFAQDSGWYVQCRYGARVIAADGTNNAVSQQGPDTARRRLRCLQRGQGKSNWQCLSIHRTYGG